MRLLPDRTAKVKKGEVIFDGKDLLKEQEEFMRHGIRGERISIISEQVLPNCMGLVIIQATMAVSQIILSIAALSYLGLGIQPPAPELGNMLSEGREYMRYSQYIMIFPGLMIALTALSLNLIGDGLRDAMDPRLRD